MGTTTTNLAGDTVPVSARNGLEAYTHRKQWEAEQPTAERVWCRRRGVGSMDRDDPVAAFDNLLHDIKRHAAEKPEAVLEEGRVFWEEKCALGSDFEDSEAYWYMDVEDGGGEYGGW